MVNRIYEKLNHKLKSKQNNYDFAKHKAREIRIKMFEIYSELELLRSKPLTFTFLSNYFEVPL